MSTALEARLQWLREAQNADGGWGFFAGKQSWLEPTAYAMLALSKDASAQDAVERGSKLIGAWQSLDGSWRPCASVYEPHSMTSLAVTLHCVRARYDEAFRKGVAWLLGMTGSENRLSFRLAHFVSPRVVEMNPSLKAWPWTPGNTSWIEPTAHALVALKRAAAAYGGGEIRTRIEQGEQMILDRRCSDGGWNYGNRRVLGHDLPSYPETTAIALYGL
ncbi:MAG: prenyltransferase/squalene oxidase repeat-containing protein, partial [Bryobacteraceae bacterium]